MTEATRTVGPNAAKKAMRKAFSKQRPIFLHGAPGLGKSDIINQLGAEMDAHVIDVRLSLWEPTDIKGIPYFDSVTGTMRWATPAELPTEEFAAQFKRIILFLDEMNSAAPSVQAAAYQLILNRRVGQYKLPDNVVIVAAGNRDSDKGVTYRMPAPLANRFLHLEMRVDWDDWFQWATENKVHKDVVGFLTFSKKDLYDFDPKSSSRAFATPRSWSFVSELLEDDDCDLATLTDLVSGAVGEGLAIKFMAHRKVASKLPNPTDIITGKVTKIQPVDVSAMYSLTVSLCYELKELSDANNANFTQYFDTFLKFLMSNFETELVLLACRLAFASYRLQPDLDQLTHFDEFQERFGKYLSNHS